MKTARSLKLATAFGFALIAMAFALTAGGEAAKRKPWEQPAGPIAGKWQVTCADSKGMLISVALDGPKSAVGVVKAVGASKQFGYRVGEQIFKLTAEDSGDWVGKHKWRGVAGAKRWDPIRFVATKATLDATMTTDNCYKRMPRVR